MTSPASDAKTVDRLQYLRRLTEMRLAPSSDGAVNHDSIVYLAMFAFGQADNAFYASGAVRCSGATPAQLCGIIDLLERLTPEASTVESFVHRVTEELGIPVASHCTFPTPSPTLPAADGRTAKAFPRQQDEQSRAIGVRTEEAETQDSTVVDVRKTLNKQPSEPKNGPFSILLMVVVGLLALAVFLGFFVQWAREGWSVAAQRNPVGGAMFFIALGIIYLIAIPLLKGKGYRSLSAAMLWLAIAAGGMFLGSLFPSCNGSRSDFPLDRPYRK